MLTQLHVRYLGKKVDDLWYLVDDCQLSWLKLDETLHEVMQSLKQLLLVDWVVAALCQLTSDDCLVERLELFRDHFSR